MNKLLEKLSIVTFLLAITCMAHAGKSIPINYLDIDGIHVAKDGLIYAASGYSGTKVYAITPDGNTFDFAEGFNGPIDLATDSQGNLFVTNFNDATVSKITPDQVVTKFADVRTAPAGIVIDRDDNLYVSHYGAGNGEGDSVLKITPNGDVSVYSEGNMLLAPVGIDIDDDGFIYTANFNDGKILKIGPDGTQSLISQIDASSGYAIGHLAVANGKIYATGLADQTIYVFRKNGKVRERGRKVDLGSFPNGIAHDDTNNQILFTYAFAKVAKIEKLQLK